MGVEYRVLYGTCDTVAASQDIVDGSWSDTPKAAAIYITKATADDSAVNDSILSRGYYDGTNQRGAAGISIDGLATTSTIKGWSNTDAIYMLEDNNTVTDAVGSVSFITGGIRITWSTNPSAAYKIMICLWGGSDVTAVAGDYFSSAVIGGTVNVTHAAGVTSDAVLHDVVFNSAPGNGLERTFTLGFWARGNNTQFCHGYHSDSNFSVSRSYASVLTARSGHYQFGAVLRQTMQLSAWVNGFTSTTLDSAASARCLFLSLNFNGVASAEVHAYDSPAALPPSGNDSSTACSFTPGMVMMVHATVTATDTQTSSASSNSIGISGWRAGNQACMSNATIYNSGTSAEQSKTDSKPVNFPDAKGSVGDVATLVSMNPDGFTLNYSAIRVTAAKWFYIAFEDAIPRVEQTVETCGEWSSPVEFDECDRFDLVLDGDATDLPSASILLDFNILEAGDIIVSHAYAGIKVDAGAGTQLLAASTWTKIDQFDANMAPSLSATPDAANDKITINDAGDYIALLQVSFEGSANGAYDLAIRHNGVAFALCKRKLGAGGDVGSASIVGLVTAAAGSTDFEAYVRAGGNNDFDVVTAQLVIMRVDGT